MANPTPGHRPDCVSDERFPFQSRFIQLRGHVLHYVDEGDGPVLLLCHGNPSWSFLYRDLIAALREQFRCIAFDYPGMGLSSAAVGFSYRAELADVAEAFVSQLDLHAVTPVVQDWGGPVGLAAAVRQPQQYRAVIIGNTWGWPATTLREKLTHRGFAALWGGPLGWFAIDRRNLFATTVLSAGHKRRRLQADEMGQYLAPFNYPGGRTPQHVLPREIVGAKALLREVEAGLPRLAELPALILWADRDFAFKNDARSRWEHMLPRLSTAPHPCPERGRSVLPRRRWRRSRRGDT